VAGKQLLVRVDENRGVVDSGGGLSEAHRDEPDLAGVVGDVPAAKRYEPACSTNAVTRSRPLTAGRPATS